MLCGHLMTSLELRPQIVFDGCGVPNTQRGDHICQVYISLPKTSDEDCKHLMNLLSKEEPSLNSFDPEVEFYKGPNEASSKRTGTTPFSSYFDQSTPKAKKKDQDGI